MQINVSKVEENYGSVEAIAIAVCTHYDGKDVVWRKIDGVFTFPYSLPFENINPKNNHFCDDIIQVENGQTIPQIYNWRRWCETAQNIFDNLKELEVTVINSKIIKPPQAKYSMEVSVPQPKIQVKEVFSKEATDV